jgi:hypothetical protein
LVRQIRCASESGASQLSIMPILKRLFLSALLLAIPGCSPRDFLTRRLATDLISQSEPFRTPQMYWLTLGVISNKDFNSPESMVLERHGWIIGTQTKCSPGIDPPPCWEVVLSPLGVDTIRPLIASGTQGNAPIGLQVARRDLVAITGVSKSGNSADVEFVWHWASLNVVGAALYDNGVYYRSTVGFRAYDDGWRVMSGALRGNQTMEDALKNAEPTVQ